MWKLLFRGSCHEQDADTGQLTYTPQLQTKLKPCATRNKLFPYGTASVTVLQHIQLTLSDIWEIMKNLNSLLPTELSVKPSVFLIVFKTLLISSSFTYWTQPLYQLHNFSKSENQKQSVHKGVRTRLTPQKCSSTSLKAVSLEASPTKPSS